MEENRYILTLKCPDGVGIVASVSSFLAENGGWILEANHHADQEENYFFMRQVIKADSLPFDLEELKKRFAPIAEKYSMEWNIHETRCKKQLVVLVSKQDHCLHDILYRVRSGSLDAKVACVISNHDVLRDMVEREGITFHHVPINKENKPEAFAEIVKLYKQHKGDVMVLARFMQIVPEAMCEEYFGEIINIHHSFLPSFIGAKPYHQAFTRGVKLIGATCHFVTADLDAGPIIEQDVVRVSHEQNAEQMVELGQDVEKTVLARGLKFHIEDRVLIRKNKTIVFN